MFLVHIPYSELLNLKMIDRLTIARKKIHKLSSRTRATMKITEDSLDENAFMSAKAYDKMIQWESRLKREIPLMVEYFQPGNVLDVACSSGRHSFALEKYGFQSLGIDVSEEMIYIAQDLKRENNSLSEFLALDASEPILPKIQEKGLENLYDNALFVGNSIANMGNIEAGKRVIRNIHMMLKPGGRFVCQTVYKPLEPYYLPLRRVEEDFVIQRIMVPVHNSDLDYNVDLHVNKINLKDGTYESQKADNHFFMYTGEEFEALVTHQGFKTIKVFGGYNHEEPREESGATLVWVFEKEEIPIFEESKALFSNYWKKINKHVENVDLEQDIVARATQIGQIASSLDNYFCNSGYRFLYPRITSHPLYTEIIRNLGSKSILDIACHMGTDLRQLIVDGANPVNLVGTDRRSEYWDLGQQLFDDRESNPMKFEEGDITSTDLLDIEAKTGKLAWFMGSFDLIHAGSLLHLLSKEDTRTALTKIYTLLAENGVFFGRMVGADKEGEMDTPNGFKYIQSINSLTGELEALGFKNIKITSMDRTGPIGERSTKDFDSFMFYAKK